MKDDERKSKGFTFINTVKVKEVMLDWSHSFHFECITKTFEVNVRKIREILSKYIQKIII